MTDIVGEILEHHGVKGQKWGFTRPRGADGRVTGTATKTKKAPPSEDHTSTRQLMRKKVSRLSNQELKKTNERLQLERTNKDLQTRGALRKIKAGTAVAGTILAVGTTITAAYNFANSPAGIALRNALKNAK